MQEVKTKGLGIELVEKMYDCFSRGDMEGIKRDVFAPDIKWHLPGRHPLGGTKYGADEVLQFFGQLIKYQIAVDLIKIVGDDEVAVEVHRGHTDKTRAPQPHPLHGAKGIVTSDDMNQAPAQLDALNCTCYYVSNGKIGEVQVFLSDQYAADNFFWSNYSLKPIPDRLA
jgi:hypothetical protein